MGTERHKECTALVETSLKMYETEASRGLDRIIANFDRRIEAKKAHFIRMQEKITKLRELRDDLKRQNDEYARELEAERQLLEEKGEIK